MLNQQLKMLKQQKKKKKDDEFFKLALKFSEIDSATIEQKSQENIIYLFDYLEDDKPQVIDDELKIEDIFIDDDYFFDSSEKQEIKDISGDMLKGIKYCLKIFQSQNLQMQRNFPK